MANQLLAACSTSSASKVGINWPCNYIQRTPEIKLRYNRKYNYQRALYKDLRIIKPWFNLMGNFKAKHGISDGDTYNFNEARFQIGVIATAKVITGFE
jgi:hypothetical protein